MNAGNVTISRLAADDLDSLEPLWSALREHHGSVAPQFGPTRERAESWAIRRGRYEEWLADTDAFALIAHLGDEPVGYAVVAIHGPIATWPGDRTGCLETLSVLPAARGAGVGSALISQARSGLAGSGITQMTIEVIAGNDDARRFYARHGFEPYFTALRGTTAPDA